MFVKRLSMFKDKMTLVASPGFFRFTGGQVVPPKTGLIVSFVDFITLQAFDIISLDFTVRVTPMGVEFCIFDILEANGTVDSWGFAKASFFASVVI